jgi:peptidoglycan/LPS O-acetylase OafA/YrhL
MPEQENKLYFKNLDAIRFIAATMVFLQHALQPILGELPIKDGLFKQMILVISNGKLGVSVFFVLSGFLITYLLVKEYEAAQKILLKHFYIRRVLRIWPLYFLVTFFTFGIFPFISAALNIPELTHGNIWCHLSFLSNFDALHIILYGVGGNAVSQNITWSVSIEEQFYIIWPLLFVYIPKRYWLHSVLLLLASSMAFQLFNYNKPMVLYFHSLSVLMDLSIGGLMAILVTRFNSIQLFFERSGTLMHIVYGCITLGLLFFEDKLWLLPYGNIISRFLITLSFALIIVAQALTKQNTLFNLHNFSFASKWGKYTYGIYLLHPIVILFVGVIVNKLGITSRNTWALLTILLVKFMITLLCSKISYQFFESKFLKLKERFI